MNRSPDKTRQQLACQISAKRLSRYATGEASVTRSYLLHNNLLTGIRHRAGIFHSDWHFDSSTVRFYRMDQMIDEMSIDGTQQRAA